MVRSKTIVIGYNVAGVITALHNEMGTWGAPMTVIYVPGVRIYAQPLFFTTKTPFILSSLPFSPVCVIYYPVCVIYIVPPQNDSSS